MPPVWRRPAVAAGLGRLLEWDEERKMGKAMRAWLAVAVLAAGWVLAADNTVKEV